MENFDNQGNYQQSKQQWTCPDCETVNTGDNCTVCGCLRPQKKPEDEAQETAAEQGCYAETVPEWICPDCETRNTGAICAACGRSRPEPRETKKRVSKKAVIAAVAAVVILISTLVGITVWLPYHRYQNACGLLESGQYEQAYQAFTEMGDYRDSASKSERAQCAWVESLGDAGQYEQALEMFGQLPDGSPEKEKLVTSCIKWAEELNDSGEYVLSLEILDSLPDSKVVDLLKTDVCYNYGLSLFKKDNNYQEAYLQLKAVGGHKDASTYLDRVISAWCEDLIDRPAFASARNFKETVKLTDEQGRQLYKLLCSKKIYTYEPVKSDGTVSWSLNANDFAVRNILLDMLPADEYEHVAELKTLFTEFDEDNPVAFLQEHRDILDTLWDAPVVQNIVMNYYCFYEWLLGTWKTENRQYTLKFERDKSDPDTISSTIDLPWVSEPAGTAHWDIKNLTYVWTDADGNILAEVYRFKLLEPDKIEVYAFKDQKTYTMIRK